MARHSNDTEEMSEDSADRSRNHHIFQRLGVEEDESTEGEESDTNNYTSHSNDTEEMSEVSTGRSRNRHIFQRLGVEEDESTEGEESDTNGHTSQQLLEDGDVTISNKDMLDCNFCYKSFSVVVFECINGHILCASCSSKTNSCVICEHNTQHSHVKVACDYEPYGCKEVVNYTQRYEHVNSCHFSPCLCPQINCSFQANSTALGEHFMINHPLRVPPFKYDKVFFTYVHIKDDVTILQEISDGELFVITCKTRYIFKMLSLYHIGSSRRKPEYVFEMLVLPHEEDCNGILQLKSEAVNVDDRTYPLSSPIFLSYDYFKDGRLSIQVRISKIGANP